MSRDTARIYLDLDNTLINPVQDLKGNVTRIVPRPHVDWFLNKMSKEGELWLLTAAERRHAKRGMEALRPGSHHFRGVISIENMKPIEEQLEIISETPGLSMDNAFELWKTIPPISTPGIMFDDFEVGSSMYYLKAAAIGIGPEQWVQVEHFSSKQPDRNGLKKAYDIFKARFPSRSVLGRMFAWA